MPAPSPPETTAQTTSYHQTLHLLSLALLPTTLVLLSLPPRRLNTTSLSLSALFLLSANHLVLERTARSIPSHVSHRLERLTPTGLPSERARRYKQERALRAQQEENQQERALRAQQEESGVVREEEGRAEGKHDKRGTLEQLWMGGETEGWKERRAKEDEERLKGGEGYGGLIVEQIWEVWNGGGKRRAGEDKEGREGTGTEGVERNEGGGKGGDSGARDG